MDHSNYAIHTYSCSINLLHQIEETYVLNQNKNFKTNIDNPCGYVHAYGFQMNILYSVIIYFYVYNETENLVRILIMIVNVL